MKYHSLMNRMKVLLCLCLVPVLCLSCLILPAAAGDLMMKESGSAGTDSPLYRKSVLFCGDSICEASTDNSPLSTDGWAGRIGTTYDMDWKNVGLSGASVSTCRGDNRIIRQVRANAGRQYDMVILHGGINDAWDTAPVGALTAADCFDPETFDPDTFAGALEELLFTAKEYYPGAVMGYIINYHCYTCEHGVIADMEDYVAVTIAACEKWDVPYLDMDHDDDFCRGVLKADTTEFLFDRVHPNGAGYDLLAPVVEAWMETLLSAPETETSTEAAGCASGTAPVESLTEAPTTAAGASGCASAVTALLLPAVPAAALLCGKRKRDRDQ